MVKLVSQERLSERSIAPVPVVHGTPALAVEYVAPALVTEYVTPLPALGFTNVVNPHVSLTAVEASAPHVMETPFHRRNWYLRNPLGNAQMSRLLTSPRPRLSRKSWKSCLLLFRLCTPHLLQSSSMWPRRQTQRSCSSSGHNACSGHRACGANASRRIRRFDDADPRVLPPLRQADRRRSCARFNGSSQCFSFISAERSPRSRPNVLPLSSSQSKKLSPPQRRPKKASTNVKGVNGE